MAVNWFHHHNTKLWLIELTGPARKSTTKSVIWSRAELFTIDAPKNTQSFLMKRRKYKNTKFPTSYEENGYNTQWKQENGGWQEERRNQGNSPLSLQTAACWSWQHTHICVSAKMGMLNPPGICWHDGTPYAHVSLSHTRTHAHACHWQGEGERRGGREWKWSTWSARAPHYRCIHIWVKGWWEGDGTWETKHCRAIERERERWTDGKTSVTWHRKGQKDLL